MKRIPKKALDRLNKLSLFFIARPILLTFILALFTSTMAYSFWIVTNGGTAITKIDSFWQQVPFYRDGWEKVHSQHFVFWSWNNMQGSDYYGANLFYYIWSPFFRIITLFPKSWIPQMMLTMNILKMAIGATLFATFVRVLGYKKWYSIVIGGLLYGFSGPMIINIFFNHFNDYFAFFPLILIASEYYLKQKKRIWLSLAIGFLGIINPYFIIFTFIIFAIYLIARWHMLYPFTWKGFWLEVLAGSFYVTLGFAIALFVILPFALQSSYSPRTEKFADIKVFFDAYGPFSILIGITVMFTSLPTFLFPASHIQASEPFYNISVQWQSLSVYAGSLPLLLLPQMKSFTSKRTFRILKYVGILMIFLLIAPFFNNIVAFFTSITYRWSYLVVAFLIIPTVHIIEHFDKIDTQKLKKTSMILALAMLLCITVPMLVGIRSYNSNTMFSSFIIRIVIPTFVFLSLTVYILLNTKFSKQRWWFLLLLTIVQSTASTAIYIGNNSALTENVINYSELQKRQTRSDIIDEIVRDNNIDRLKERFWIDEFSQTDFSQFAFNHSLYYNVNNQLIYHSLYNSSTNDYYNLTHAFNENITFWARNLELNQVYFDNLNVNYIITQNPDPTFIPSQFIKVSEKDTSLGKYYLYRNYGNSGFFKSYSKTIRLNDAKKAYPINTSRLLNERLIVSDSEVGENTEYINQLRDDFIKQNKDFFARIGNIVWTSDYDFTIPSPTDYQFKAESIDSDYVFYNSKKVTIYVNDRKVDTSNYCLPETARHSIPCSIISIPVKKGDILKLAFDTSNFSLVGDNRFGFVKNTSADYQQAIEDQKINYNFSDFNENGFTAEVDVTKENSYTYMAVPYAKGQTFFVDNQKKEPEIVNGGYLAFKLPPGKHTIKMTYMSPGFTEGALVSSASLVVAISISIGSTIKAIRTKKKRGNK